MTEVLDVQAVQNGSWWLVSVPSMPGLMAQVSSLQPRQLSAALSASTAASDVADITVRRIRQVAPVQGAAGAGLASRERRGGGSWTEQAVQATRLRPSRVAALLAD
jgi:hypothetical protein